MSNLTNAQRTVIAGALGHLVRFFDRDGGDTSGDQVDVGGLTPEKVTVRIDGKDVEAYLSPAEVNRVVRDRSRIYLASWVAPALAMVLADADNLYANRWRSAHIDLVEQAQYEYASDVAVADRYVAAIGYTPKEA